MPIELFGGKYPLNTLWPVIYSFQVPITLLEKDINNNGRLTETTPKIEFQPARHQYLTSDRLWEPRNRSRRYLHHPNDGRESSGANPSCSKGRMDIHRFQEQYGITIRHHRRKEYIFLPSRTETMVVYGATFVPGGTSSSNWFFR